MTDDDLTNLARGHLQALPDDFLSRLGFAYLKRFYRYADSSLEEKLFVIRDADERIVSSCCLSLSTQDLIRRTLRHTLSDFMRSFVEKFFKDKKYRRHVYSVLKDLLSRRYTFFEPEVLCIFTLKKFRGKGLARELLKKMELSLREQSYGSYYVKTEFESENKALSFYKKNGFKEYQYVRLGEREFFVLKKDLKIS